jgi:hypothetical protein
VAAKRLLECSFLIPIRRDRNLSDGTLHPRKAWKWLPSRLFEFAGGTQSLEALTAALGRIGYRLRIVPAPTVALPQKATE